MVNPPKVVAIILNYNCADETIKCTEGLLSVDYSALQIIVVDNASQESDQVLLGRLQGRILKVIFNPTNLGYSAGNNVGIKYALEKTNADYVLIINPDIKVKSNFLRELIRTIEIGGKIGICAPVQCFLNKPEIVYSAGGRLWWFLGQQQMLYSGKSIKSLFNFPSEVEFVSGGCMLIRKALLQKALLPEEYFLQWEDMDYCKQAQRQGYKVVIVPKSLVWHKIGLTIKKGDGVYCTLRRSIRNRFIFFLKYCNYPAKRIVWVACFSSFTFPIYISHRIFIRHDKQGALALTQGFIEGLKYKRKI